MRTYCKQRLAPEISVKIDGGRSTVSLVDAVPFQKTSPPICSPFKHILIFTVQIALVYISIILLSDNLAHSSATPFFSLTMYLPIYLPIVQTVHRFRYLPLGVETTLQPPMSYSTICAPRDRRTH